MLTDFTMPEGWDADKSLIASVGFGAKLPPGLENWSYTPKIQAVRQLPQLKALPQGAQHLDALPLVPVALAGAGPRHQRAPPALPLQPLERPQAQDLEGRVHDAGLRHPAARASA